VNRSSAGCAANKGLKGQLDSRSDPVCYRFYSSLTAPLLQRANSHPRIEPSQVPKAYRGRYGYLYNTIYLAPGPRATMLARTTALRRLDTKEISVIIDYRRGERKRDHRGQKIRHRAHVHPAYWRLRRAETLQRHAASSGLDGRLHATAIVDIAEGDRDRDRTGYFLTFACVLKNAESRRCLPSVSPCVPVSRVLE